jgi:hypothetical protein
LNFLLATALVRDNMFSFAGTRVAKVVWYGDVSFKQWAIIEFLVAEKESVMNIQK